MANKGRPCRAWTAFPYEKAWKPQSRKSFKITPVIVFGTVASVLYGVILKLFRL